MANAWVVRTVAESVVDEDRVPTDELLSLIEQFGSNEHRKAAGIEPVDVAALLVTQMERMHADWQAGRLPSPDSRDFVIVADELLTAYDLGYHGSTEAGRDFVADVLHEKLSNGSLAENHEVAAWLVKELTAE